MRRKALTINRCKRARSESRPDKARIHTGGVRQPQHQRYSAGPATKNHGQMTRSIDRILQPGETVAYTTTLHQVVYLPAVGLWLLAFVVDGGWRSRSGLAIGRNGLRAV